MLQTVLVGVGAGATAALLFAVASGTALSLLLALLAPLPILIVALGWSPVAGLVASISAAAMLSAAIGFQISLGFLLGVGVPAILLIARKPRLFWPALIVVNIFGNGPRIKGYMILDEVLTGLQADGLVEMEQEDGVNAQELNLAEFLRQ